MSGFLYYVPGHERPTVTAEELRERGIDYAFDGRWTAAAVRGGPDEQHGSIIADQQRVAAERIGYYPQQQTWRRIPASALWIGYYTAERPGPADLIRPEPLEGHLVTLGDGRAWMAPIARAWFEIEQPEEHLVWFCKLPEAVTLDDEGNWASGAVVAQYRPLWEIAERWWDAINGADLHVQDKPQRVRFDFEGINDAALLALGTNYRLGRVEVDVLGLFTDQTVHAVLGALIDWPTMEQFLKKKLKTSAAGGSGSAPGPPAGPPDTGPP